MHPAGADRSSIQPSLAARSSLWCADRLPVSSRRGRSWRCRRAERRRGRRQPSGADVARGRGARRRHRSSSWSGCSSRASSPVARSAPRPAASARHRDHRQPVVVGGPLPTTRSRAERFTTANELHIPSAGRCELELRSHRRHPQLLGARTCTARWTSFPGADNTLWLQADAPGVYRGQCAEYCGLQHAKMALLVVAEPPDDFERVARAASARRPPSPPTRRRSGAAAASSWRRVRHVPHRSAGTTAGAATGPRPHARREPRARSRAGTLPNTRGHLAGWIADPQALKPGNRMPPTGRSSRDDLHALLAYLETLQ